jgi:hypothetical protein
MTTTLKGGEGSASRPGRSLPPGKPRHPFYRRLGETQGQSGQVRKISPSPGFDTRTAQPVASRYTDWATGRTLPCIYYTTFKLIYYLELLYTVSSSDSDDNHLPYKRVSWPWGQNLILFNYYVDRWLSAGYRIAFRAFSQRVSSSRMPTSRYNALIISLSMKLGLRANVGFVNDRRIQLRNMSICCFVARHAVRSCHYSCWNVIPTSYAVGSTVLGPLTAWRNPLYLRHIRFTRNTKPKPTIWLVTKSFSNLGFVSLSNNNNSNGWWSVCTPNIT